MVPLSMLLSFVRHSSLMNVVVSYARSKDFRRLVNGLAHSASVYIAAVGSTSVLCSPWCAA